MSDNGISLITAIHIVVTPTSKDITGAYKRKMSRTGSVRENRVFSEISLSDKIEKRVI